MRFCCLAVSIVLMPLFLASCEHSTASFSDLNAQDVTLPGGEVIHAERMIDPVDQMRGMMFRTSLAPDRGMLYIHNAPGLYSYWTYRYEIPLDMIWMDSSRDIVEMVENVPPCRTVASQCPKYGGTKVARYHLELAAGMARKYGLKLGDKLEF